MSTLWIIPLYFETEHSPPPPPHPTPYTQRTPGTVNVLLHQFRYMFLIPEERLGMCDVPLLSGISGLSFDDSPFLFPLTFFCLVLLLFLPCLFFFFLLMGHSPAVSSRKFSLFLFIKSRLLLSRWEMMVGGMCSLLPCGTGICYYAVIFFLNCYCFYPFLFFFSLARYR